MTLSIAAAHKYAKPAPVKHEASAKMTLGGGMPTHAPAPTSALPQAQVGAATVAPVGGGKAAPMSPYAAAAADPSSPLPSALRAASSAAITGGSDLTALTQALTGLTKVLQGLAGKLAADGAPSAAPVSGGGALGAPAADIKHDKKDDDKKADKKADKKSDHDKKAKADKKNKADKPKDPPPAGADGDRAKIVAAAQKEVDKNITEDAGANEDKGGNIAKYRESTGGKRGPEEWCADFTSYIFQKAGVKLGKDGKGSPAVNVIKDWGKSTGKWKTSDPKPGDSIIFNWDGNKGAQGDHIGIVEKVENGKVHTIEGNSGDKLQRKSYALDANVVQGYVNAV